MSQANQPGLGPVARLQAEVKRDPKKAAILGILVVVFLIVGVREVARRAGSPGSSSAATVTTSAQPAANTTAGAAAGHKALESKGAGESYDLAVLRVSRDIFTPDEEYFPAPEPKTREKPKPKPGLRVMDPNAAAQAARLQVIAQAATLVLQTTVIGERPTALINGRIVRIGDTIAGFKVVDINSRSCQLERDGIRVALDMEK